MGAREDALGILDEQYRAYRDMYRVSLEQRACIQREDLAGLDASFERMHRLMDQIRMRQADVGDGNTSASAEVRQRREALQHIVRELSTLNQANQTGVRELLDRTRGELQHVGKGRRAARGYRDTRARDAQFFDGTR